MPSTSKPTQIAMWSGPRNISTALMRAFENRPDTIVWDEPFYAHYLKSTGLDHPMAREIIEAYETDWRAIVKRLTQEPQHTATIFFQKHMTHHMLPYIDLDWLGRVSNCFLIRNPIRVINSYILKRQTCTIDDLGYARQLEIYEEVVQLTGCVPPIIDADDLLAEPEQMLNRLCGELGIPFTQNMLLWPTGRREDDGIWGRHWYNVVENSRGFSKPTPKKLSLSQEMQDTADEAKEFYDLLYSNRLKSRGK